MQAGNAVNLWVQVKLMKLLRQAQARRKSINLCLHTVMQIMDLQGKGKTGRRINEEKFGTVAEILMDEFGVKDIELLLTALLFDLHNKDIISALPVAHLFGGDICFMVDLLTRHRQRGQNESRHYKFVVDRFNSATAGKENRLMTTVVLIEMAACVLLLRSSLPLPTCGGRAGGQQLHDFIDGFLNLLNLELIDGKFVHSFAHAREIIMACSWDTILKQHRIFTPSMYGPVSGHTCPISTH